jgi:hypothetical protein
MLLRYAVLSRLKPQCRPILAPTGDDECPDERYGHADPIVSGDDDLLALNPFRDIPIVTPAMFVQGVAR